MVAIATFFSSFTTPMLASLMSVGIFVAGRLSRDILQLGQGSGDTGTAAAAEALYRVLPDLEAFEDLVRGWPEVRECHMLAGETDFLLKIVAEDWETYQRFVTEKLTAAPKVSHVKSALSIRASKNQPGVPVEVGESG